MEKKENAEGTKTEQKKQKQQKKELPIKYNFAQGFENYLMAISLQDARVRKIVDEAIRTAIEPGVKNLGGSLSGTKIVVGAFFFDGKELFFRDGNGKIAFDLEKEYNRLAIQNPRSMSKTQWLAICKLAGDFLEVDVSYSKQ